MVKKDVFALVRTSREERDLFNRIAQDNGLSLSALVRFLILKLGREQGYTVPVEGKAADA